MPTVSVDLTPSVCFALFQLRREVEVERQPVSSSIKDLLQFVQNNIQVNIQTYSLSFLYPKILQYYTMTLQLPRFTLSYAGFESGITDQWAMQDMFMFAAYFINVTLLI